MSLKERFEEWWISSEFAVSKNQFIAIAILAFVIGGAWFVVYAGQTPSKPVVKVSEQKSTKKEVKRMVIVHVGGAVRSPDVYELESGSRVIDAVKMAGGFMKNADKDSLNLAAQLKDSQKIQVLIRGNSNLNQGVVDSVSINLNTASEEQLRELPGIGEVMAKRIIEFRQEKGSFGSIDELKEIEGIGEKKFKKIKEKASL